MKMIFILLFFAILLHTEAAPTSLDCPSILKTAGASELFGVYAGHAIHSMTVEALKKFEPFVTVDNKVPTANFLASSSGEVLRLHAPESKYKPSDDFKTDSMRILDHVLSNMDKASPYKHGTPLEQVVHEYHMEELWATMLPEYQKLKVNPPNNVTAVCGCAMDMENNKIFQTLRLAALRHREPGLMFYPENELGKQKIKEEDKCPLRFKVLFGATAYGLTLEDLKKHDASSNDDLCGSKAWNKFLEHLKSVNRIYDSSLFLYCALNHA